jgi:hypothetical protein
MNSDLAAYMTNVLHLQTIWKVLLSFVDYFIALFLIAIAFTNILRIQIDTYTIKKTLPSLIIGVILANLSWFICMGFIEVSTLITNGFIQLVNDQTGSTMNWFMQLEQTAGGAVGDIIKSLGGVFGASDSSTAFAGGIIIITFAALTGGGCIMFAFSVLLILAPLVFLTIVQFLLLGRVIFLSFLVISSPLAFLAMGFPATQKLFQKWWGEFTKWIFMYPIMFILIMLALLMANKINV